MYRRMQTDTVNSAVASDVAESEHHRPPTPLPLLDQYLADQQELSAVVRFAQLHEAHALPVQEKHYRSLIPLSQPGAGQQYGFEVDLDRCTGCKACVTACHSMNGLEVGETWRMVGLLHGGTPEQPIQKTVTSTCHHCLEPTCMHGCPVGAYEKDALTGIVRHLDDQCIGCRYCMLTCPYEVPQYSARKGIVRKCDMCAERLADGEAPACVQACPNAAIAIRIVDQATAIEDAQGDAFLPGVPSPGITIPTTNYTTQHAFPRNMLPADFYAVRTAHQHLSLVFMLVLTQLSVGTFCLDQLLPLWLNPATLHLLRPLHGALALLLGVVALLASTVHLGRPQYAWRAFIGLRTSWLSREIIAFAAFALLAALYAGARYQFDNLPVVVRQSVDGLGHATALVGVLALFCSIMLYHVTRRQWWSGGRTGFKFAFTSVLLGWAVMLTVAFGIAAVRGVPLSAELIAFARSGACSLAALTVIKLGGEAAIFLHLRDRQQGDLKRSALLLTGDLRNVTSCRFLLGLLGGIFVPLVFLSGLTPTRIGLAIAASILSLVCLLSGEIFERMTFFTALSAPRMPGGLS
jgi:formate dehydrogenase iron-sulfur subunit